MRTLRSHAGYLEIDHSNSPGLRPEDVAHLPGTVAVSGGQHFERDVKLCSHCQRAVILEPNRTRERGYCSGCHHYICDACEVIRAKTGACAPMAQRLDVAAEIAEKYLGQPDHPDNTPEIVLTDL